MIKRLTAVLVAVCLITAMLPVRASASGAVGWPHEWVASTFWELNEWMAHGAGSALNRWWESGPMAFWDGLTGGKEQAERDFVSNVVDTIGTPIITNDGFIVPLYATRLLSGFPSGTVNDTVFYPEFGMHGLADLNYNGAYMFRIHFYSYVGEGLNLSYYVMPVAGQYRYLCDWFYSVPSGVSVPDAFLYDGAYVDDWNAWKSAGSGAQIARNLQFGVNMAVPVRSDYIIYSRVVIQVKPTVFSLPDFTQNIGGDYTRIGNVDFTVAVQQDNDTVVIEDVFIVNETDNSVYNPVTDITSIITDWTYDFSNRSYDLTLDTGDKMTVTYGDEHITIIEGGTTYNVYYVIPDGDGGGEDGPGPTEPGCPTEPGGGGDYDDSFWRDLAERAKAALKALSSFFAAIPEFWGDMQAFMAGFFGVLPDEGAMILNFIAVGVGVAVAVGLFKLFVFR